MPPEKELALEWLEKARHDLFSAKAVLESDYGITDVPCFHAQQTVEKSYKALLTWHNVSFGRTHDLLVLLSEIVTLDPAFQIDRSICEELAEFAVDVRYPGVVSEPPKQEAERFVCEAGIIYERVQSMLR